MLSKKIRLILVVAVAVIAVLAIALILRSSPNGVNSSDTSSAPIPTMEALLQDENIILDNHTDYIRDGMFYGPVPENIRPVILVKGIKYYWMGTTYLLEGADVPNGSVSQWSGVNHIPKNYTEYGSLKEISNEEPTKDGQMKAGFAASGTIYTSEETPEAVYVCMTSELTGEKRYTRFISEKLDQGYCVKWNGRCYRILHDRCEEISEMPEACECVGTMRYVGMDKIPEQDLQTNAPGDGKSFEGREVFFDVKKPDFIYYEEHVNKRVYTYKCPLWDAE